MNVLNWSEAGTEGPGSCGFEGLKEVNRSVASVVLEEIIGLINVAMRSAAATGGPGSYRLKIFEAMRRGVHKGAL